MDTINSRVEKKILVVGCGGIGSFVVSMLCRMGNPNLDNQRQRDLIRTIFKMQLWDKDVVGKENLTNQCFFVGDVKRGLSKVDALLSMAEKGLGMNRHEVDNIDDITVKNEWFMADASKGDFDFDPDIIITGLDSMDMRIKLWHGGIKQWFNSSRQEGKDKLLIDARISALSQSIYCVSNKEEDQESVVYYERSGLYTDEEAAEDRDICTAKSTIFTAYGIASRVGEIVFKWNEQRGQEGIPYVLSYDCLDGVVYKTGGTKVIKVVQAIGETIGENDGL